MADPTREQDEFVGLQGLARRLNASSNKASILFKASTLLFILLIKNFFTKFIKAFVESIKAWEQEQVEFWEQLLKARFPKIYSEKSHIDYYHFC